MSRLHMEFGPSNLAALAWRLTPIAWPFLMVGLVFVGVAGWRLEVRVEPQAKRLLGTAEVADYPEIFAYLQRLKREAIFTSVVLSSHQINENDKQKPYRFEFTLIWKDTP